MKRFSLLVATLAVVACNGDKLTGTAAQHAAVKYQNAATTLRPLVFVDGKEIPWEQARAMEHNSIESVEVLKGAAAIKLHGDRARDGVILIETKGTR